MTQSMDKYTCTAIILNSTTALMWSSKLNWVYQVCYLIDIYNIVYRYCYTDFTQYVYIKPLYKTVV